MTTVTVPEFDSATLDIAAAAAAYREQGCCVVRGLGRPYLGELLGDAAISASEALALLPRAEHSPGIGWYGPDGTLFLPAPPSFGRAQQIQILGMGYRSSAAMLRSALDPRTLDLVEAVLGPDVELFAEGQVPYKEPGGGYAKRLHQDAAYFEHRGEGPLAVLIYGVDTDLRNGALHVVPGSHRRGSLRHVDSDTHQALAWSWDDAAPIAGAAGDAILFHVHAVHGSRENASDRPRPVFIHRYRACDDYVVAGGITAAQRAESEARGGAVEKPAHERGFVVRGRRRLS